ncbi:MAG TPA: response regulator transcription factor [Fontimonas sp.]
MGPSVLVVSGDEALCATICTQLARARMRVQAEKAATMPGSTEGRFDIVVCDIDLPKDAGCELVMRLRLDGRCGIVAVSSAPQRESRMLAMRLGADHFFPVPLDAEELEVAIRNLHRRMRGDSMASGTQAAVPALPSGATVIPDAMAPATAVAAKSGDSAWGIDLTHWRLICPQGQATHLSFPEYRVLQRLASSPGEVVSRDDLLTLLGHGGVRVYGRNLDMMMSRLRRKVHQCCEEALPIYSARGVGYVFNGRAQLLS